MGPVSTILPTPTPEIPKICGVSVPDCFCDMINTIIVKVSCDVSGLVGVHQIEFECNDDRPWVDKSSVKNCFKHEWEPVMYYIPGEGWTECPICKMYEEECSMPEEYPGAIMRYTGRSCGDKVYYSCEVGDFGGFVVDTCIRHHNASNGKFEMRWHREFNSEQQGCLVTCPIDIEKMKIKCGRTVYPIPVANPGSKITWIPQNGFKLTCNESVCQSDGTWSKGPPCCYKDDNACNKLTVNNGIINRSFNCVNGENILNVSCLPGYTLYGCNMFTCNGGITGPPGMWPPSCVNDSLVGTCLPPKPKENAKIVRVTYFSLPLFTFVTTEYQTGTGKKSTSSCLQRYG
jgi:hypothetical protein